MKYVSFAEKISLSFVECAKILENLQLIFLSKYFQT